MENNGFLGTINNPTIHCKKAKNIRKTEIVFSEQLHYVMKLQTGCMPKAGSTMIVELISRRIYALNGTGAEVLTNTDGTYRGNYNLSQTTTTDINADFLVGGSKQFGKFSVDASFGGNTLRTEFKNMSQSCH